MTNLKINKKKKKITILFFTELGKIKTLERVDMRFKIIDRTNLVTKLRKPLYFFFILY